MISIMTNAGALEFSRGITGGPRFLAWKAALLADNFEGMTAKDVASLGPDDVNLDAGLINGKRIVKLFDCTGALPVKVSYDDGSDTTSAVAVDLDFNGQVPIDGGTISDISYKAVVALGRRYYKYEILEMNRAYSLGAHVWGNSERTSAYMCLTDNFVYAGVSPEDDTENWVSLGVEGISQYPGEKDLYTNTAWDVVPFFITSYDNQVTMSNGMEWEYKVRVFLDNVVTAELSKLSDFSSGGLEANGSLMLTFLAGISEQFRTIREQITTAG